MADSGKKPGLFSRIETRQDALKLVRDGSIAFLVLAGLQALIGFSTANSRRRAGPSRSLDAHRS